MLKGDLDLGSSEITLDWREVEERLVGEVELDKGTNDGIDGRLGTGDEISPNGDSVDVSNEAKVEATREAVRLRHWEEMPRHLQFNPHIHTGYRPLLTVKGSLLSLFYVHNETVNILTHGFPIAYILLTVPPLLPWYEGFHSHFLSWCHLLGCVSPWIGSVFYHTMMNLDYGEDFYQVLLIIDMLGIWICQSIGALPMISIASHCHSLFVWTTMMLLYCVLSVYSLSMAMCARSSWERRLCFLPQFSMRMIVLAMRVLNVGGGSFSALTNVVLQDLLAVIGAAIGALRVPEKFFPGKVDHILNSHNIMHILVVMAVNSMHQATLMDLEWMANPNVCNSTHLSISTSHDEL